MLNGKLNEYSVLFGFAVNGQILEFGFAFVEIQNVINNTAVVLESFGIKLVVVAQIGKFYG